MLNKLKFPVSIKQLEVATDKGFGETGVIGIFDDRDLEKGVTKPLGFHTSDYILTTNEELINSTQEIMDDMGLKYNVEKSLSWTNRQRMYLSLVTEKEFSPNGDDPHRLMLTVKNSYDGTVSWGIELGFYRLICSNGAYALHLMKVYKKKHLVAFDKNLLREQIQSSMIRFPELKEYLKRLKDATLNKEKLDKLFENALSRGLTNKTEMGEMRNIAYIDLNGYKVFCAITYYLTHLASSYERAKRLNAYITSKLLS